MSKPSRDDLRVVQPNVLTCTQHMRAHRDLTDAEFDAIARKDGWVKLGDESDASLWVLIEDGQKARLATNADLRERGWVKLDVDVPIALCDPHGTWAHWFDGDVCWRAEEVIEPAVPCVIYRGWDEVMAGLKMPPLDALDPEGDADG
jgi:hypothetical protein